MDQVLLALTCLILLRLTRQSPPPVLSSWLCYDVQYLDHLHEILASPSSAIEESANFDLGLHALQSIMAASHDLQLLRRSWPVLRDQWLRFVRRHSSCLDVSLCAAVRILVSRCHRTLMTADDVHSRGIESWYLILFLPNASDEAG